ncbi:N-acetylglucosamine-6-phosphate deacetylase [Cohnella silvisoli]|uniref:N-acetylglucosamine-6-phosphate deacetylase n=1 Tax=Cohnella silvisoli TaxID=2873699 RepID=A0ABV1KRX6_9BACL|nr:N-acetylglucosamine-6-phosphate deacetylase [Cohnella silvisoli]MCD9021674.1 N-acetylglucosamine-6-phosphate deacetylase [Cohnella silvisoli]
MNAHSDCMTIIYNGKIVMENDGVIDKGTMVWQGERIVYAGHSEQFDRRKFEQGLSVVAIDAQGGWVLPGFIDVHVHGGNGRDFMEADAKAYDTITRYHGRHGTTGMLATTVTAPQEAISRVISAAAAYRSGGVQYAELVGVHLEGPFISPRWPGAQDPRHIVPPRLDWLEGWVSEFPELIKMLTLAPELDGSMAVIQWLSEHGIVPTCGHTDATYECILEAVGHGLRHAAHTYNAMKGLHHREPGTLGAVLSEDRISAEIIADGYHVHPACIRLLSRVKPDDRLILITDAIPASGLSDGSYTIAGLDVIVKDSVSRLKEGGNLAGCTLTMIEAFRFMVREVGLSVERVSRFASGNPARLLGLDAEMGSLATGKLANVLLLSPDLAMRNVWVRGRSISG